MRKLDNIHRYFYRQLCLRKNSTFTLSYRLCKCTLSLFHTKQAISRLTRNPLNSIEVGLAGSQSWNKFEKLTTTRYVPGFRCLFGVTVRNWCLILGNFWRQLLGLYRGGYKTGTTTDGMKNFVFSRVFAKQTKLPSF